MKKTKDEYNHSIMMLDGALHHPTDQSQEVLYLLRMYSFWKHWKVFIFTLWQSWLLFCNLANTLLSSVCAIPVDCIWLQYSNQCWKDVRLFCLSWKACKVMMGLWICYIKALLRLGLGFGQIFWSSVNARVVNMKYDNSGLHVNEFWCQLLDQLGAPHHSVNRENG